MVLFDRDEKSQVPLRQRHSTRDDGDESTGTTEFRSPGPLLSSISVWSRVKVDGLMQEQQIVRKKQENY